MGLLEQLLERLEKLNARLDALERGGPVTAQTATTTPGPVVTINNNTDAVVTVTTPELDSAGLPWDERIHAGTKRQNADGSWTLKKGVDKELVAQVIEELKGTPVTTTAPATPVTPAAPVKPGAPATPAAPVKPGAPATPAAPEKPSADGATVKAAKAANTLTNQYGVDYDDIVATLLTPLGVEMFGSLTTEQAGEVLKGLESWVAELSTLTEEFDGIRDMAKGTEHETTIAEGLGAFINTYEGKDGKLGTVPMGKLHELYVAVCDWANQWEAFLKG